MTSEGGQAWAWQCATCGRVGTTLADHAPPGWVWHTFYDYHTLSTRVDTALLCDACYVGVHTVTPHLEGLIGLLRFFEGLSWMWKRDELNRRLRHGEVFVDEEWG